ncbi:MAG TPA: bifunctional oligoribonuclease/PAP phosphatase NrnA [Lysinibacillus sp.]|uniref:DHH family phosphoesterase n=1 Tax=Lysinibacillus TaxID=400634 RepID=UPI000880EA48|nr:MULTISPECIES: bifunctional oligoribonuclease/PAP phosphatase NrnA [unclassified Lysinibacillus]MEE3805512.1 bifunctional oligoribonuclease/PAP phosphatase NrnA [Lysinibacillus fusiformis]HBT70806.1 bifunctional oligoribonuclease/PAP phosphatase NrnA [Lysinibacillus sp.]SCY96002.1 phosphoesterase RecJ domain-containing protein [Lysinibacillus sp. SG9]SDB28928.1 phosphoesterase RecJ domain-containing protein [Lysinibacillus sp. TC-37]SFS90002.1 phosphoesterase RecJ domain-containing protein [
MKRQIIDTIKAFETIIIHRHVRPDPDAYGSQQGLKEIILANYPEKKVFAVGEHDASLSFMAQPDEIADDMYDNALVIVTDTANTERVDDQRYTKGKMVIKIDHHPNDDAYGDLLWVDTTASSCSEMIYALYEEGKAVASWQLTDAAARLLFAGIVGDTGRFQFPSTTAKTFKVASELITYDFDRNQIFDGMYEMEQKLLNLQGYIYQNFTMDEHGAAYVKLTKELLAEYNTVPSEASLLVGCLGSVKGICAWVVFIEEVDQIRVRLRSKGPVINTLAKEFNGGGHPLASGATAYSWEEADHVISRLQEMCKAYH